MKNNFDQIFGNPQRSGILMVVVNSILIFGAGYLVSRIFMKPINDSSPNKKQQLLGEKKDKINDMLPHQETMRKMIQEEISESIKEGGNKNNVIEKMSTINLMEEKKVSKT